MSYTGVVQRGGPTQRRDLPGLTIHKLSVSAMDNNVYLLTCTRSGEQLLIDAADDAARILDMVRRGVSQDAGAAVGTRLSTIVTTHRHWDHHRALAEVARATGARTAAGEADADELPVAPDLRLQHGDTVHFGEVALDVIQLRGHTPGSVALAYTEPDDLPGSGRSHLWTGDSLFPGGVGNTDHDPMRFNQLLDDVTDRVFAVYGDDSWVYPGHGGDTTLGAERPNLTLWRRRGW